MRQNLTDEEKIAAHHELVIALHRCVNVLRSNIITRSNAADEGAALNQATRALVMVGAI